MDQNITRPALLIDARNALYRAVFAVKNDRRSKIKYHYFMAFLRQLSTWINAHNPDSVHVFWDAPRQTVWRRKILETYKKRDKSKYVEDISADLAITTKVSQEFFKHMNVRQYSKKSMEADDLIFASVTLMHPKPCIIVSTDGDMTQIPFVYSNTSVYDPTKREIVEVPTHNPVIQKALVGDTSDNIKGYRGIGPKKSIDLMEDQDKFQAYLGEHGRGTLVRNLLLIDLSLNPKLLANKMYIHRELNSPINYDSDMLQELARKHKVNGFLAEYRDLVPRFKKLT